MATIKKIILEEIQRLNRGEIRKKGDRLLDLLNAAYLNNLTCDNRDNIKKALNDIETSGIDWEHDVVKSVREKYKLITNPKVINTHMSRHMKEGLEDDSSPDLPYYGDRLRTIS